MAGDFTVPEEVIEKMRGAAQEETMRDILKELERGNSNDNETRAEAEARKRLDQQNQDQAELSLQQQAHNAALEHANVIHEELGIAGKSFIGHLTKAGSLVLNSFNTMAEGQDDFGSAMAGIPELVGGIATTVLKAGFAIMATVAELASKLLGMGGFLVSMVPIVGGVLGAITKIGQGLTKAAQVILESVGPKLAELVGQIISRGLEIALKSIQSQWAMFKELTNTGVIFGDGMTGLTETMFNMNLNFAEFTNVVKNSRDAITTFGGNLTGGLKLMTAVTGKWTKQQVEGMRRLGIGYEDQQSGLASFLETQALAGQQDFTQTNALRNASYEYMTNLQTISALTGEDIKKLKEKAREASLDIAVQTKLRKLRESDPNAAAKFDQVYSEIAQTAGPAAAKAFKQQFATGVVTDAFIINSPLMKGISSMASSIGDGSPLSASVGYFTKFMKTNADAIDKSMMQWAPAAMGAMLGANLPGAISKSLESATMVLPKNVAAHLRDVDGALASVEKAVAGTDKATNKLIGAADNMREAFKAIQKEITRNMGELATGIKMVTDVQLKIIGLTGDAIRDPEEAGKKFMDMFDFSNPEIKAQTAVVRATNFHVDNLPYAPGPGGKLGAQSGAIGLNLDQDKMTPENGKIATNISYLLNSLKNKINDRKTAPTDADTNAIVDMWTRTKEDYDKDILAIETRLEKQMKLVSEANLTSSDEFKRGMKAFPEILLELQKANKINKDLLANTN